VNSDAKAYMRTVHKTLLGLALLLPTISHAQAKCPWLTEPTARGVLGGALKATITLTAKHGGVCEFSRQQGPMLLELRISVEIMTDIPKQFPAHLAQCPPNSQPVRAIGNEAVTCSVQDQTGATVEKIVSRVRDQAFVVTLSSSAQNDPMMTPQQRSEKAHLVAEQVAGILF
jgi:hypothetical protein